MAPPLVAPPLEAPPLPCSPLGPPPAGTACSANFPPPVLDSPSPPASLPAAAVALAPAGRGWGAQWASGGKHWAAGSPASPHLPPYLSLQAVEGAGLRLWQLTEQRGLGLDLGWGASLAQLLLSGPPSQPQMSSGLFCARPPLGPLIHLFIHSLTHSNIHPSNKYLSSIYCEPGTVNHACPRGLTVEWVNMNKIYGTSNSSKCFE